MQIAYSKRNWFTNPLWVIREKKINIFSILKPTQAFILFFGNLSHDVLCLLVSYFDFRYSPQNKGHERMIICKTLYFIICQWFSNKLPHILKHIVCSTPKLLICKLIVCRKNSVWKYTLLYTTKNNNLCKVIAYRRNRPRIFLHGVNKDRSITDFVFLPPHSRNFNEHDRSIWEGILY